MRKLVFISLVLGSFIHVYPQHDHGANSRPDINKAFTLIKSLVGNWKGSFTWTGARTGEGKMDAHYYVTGNGSAVVEDLMIDGQPVMTSVYHLDGTDLRATHFCAAGNQPRLKADAFNEKEQSVNFQFVDITNLPTPGSPHVKGLEVEFEDSNQIAVTFTFINSGALSYEHIKLSRVRAD
jgi:hypothetical protein